MWKLFENMTFNNAFCIWSLFVGPPSVNGRSRLVIDNAMKRDGGTYMCVAENPAGKRRALAAVRVKGMAYFSYSKFNVALKSALAELLNEYLCIIQFHREY